MIFVKFRRHIFWRPHIIILFRVSSNSKIKGNFLATNIKLIIFIQFHENDDSILSAYHVKRVNKKKAQI